MTSQDKTPPDQSRRQVGYAFNLRRRSRTFVPASLQTPLTRISPASDKGRQSLRKYFSGNIYFVSENIFGGAMTRQSIYNGDVACARRQTALRSRPKGNVTPTLFLAVLSSSSALAQSAPVQQTSPYSNTNILQLLQQATPANLPTGVLTHNLKNAASQIAAMLQKSNDLRFMNGYRWNEF
jgi:hypothetical protein